MSRTVFDFRKGSYAFTLVELLVVVAIIALLVSILLPTLSKAKEHAKIVVCQTNLKGLGIGYTFYTNKHDGWYPASAGYGGDPPTWDYRMLDDYGNIELLSCPSDTLDRSEELYDSRTPTGLCPGIKRAPRSYASNICVSYRGASAYGDSKDPPYNDEVPYTPAGTAYKMTDVDIASDTILLGDEWESFYYGSGPQPGVHGDYKGSGMWNGMWTNTVYPPAPSRIETYYHSGDTKANFLFGDTHVEILPEGHPKLSDLDGDGVNDPEDFYYFKREKL